MVKIAKYTMSLHEIVRGMMLEEGITNPHTSTDNLIQFGVSKFFDDYPIFDEKYRQELNTKIVRHFFTQEIGYETYGQWRFEFNNKLNEIMPYYNKLYELELDGLMPFDDTNYYDDFDGTQASGGKRFNRKAGEGFNKNSSHSDGLSKDDTLSNTSSKDGGVDFNEHRYGKTTTTTDTQVKERHTDFGRDNTTSENYTKESSEKETKTGQDIQSVQATPSVVKFSDTPQGALSDAKSGKYLTNITITETDGSAKNPITYDNTVSHTGSPAEKSIHYVDNNGSNENVTERVVSGDIKVADGGTDTDTSNYGKTNNVDMSSNDIGRKSDENIGFGVNKNVELSNSTSEDLKEDSSERHVHGKMNSGKSYIELIEEYRNVIMNIDLLVFEQLADCFMSIW